VSFGERTRDYGDVGDLAPWKSSSDVGSQRQGVSEADVVMRRLRGDVRGSDGVARNDDERDSRDLQVSCATTQQGVRVTRHIGNKPSRSAFAFH